jgi:hypothetical protein
MAAARARASVCFRDCDRIAEYAVGRAGFLAESVVLVVPDFARAVDRTDFAGVLARARVVAAAASFGAAPIPMRLTRAREAYSESFLFKRQTPALRVILRGTATAILADNS